MHTFIQLLEMLHVWEVTPVEARIYATPTGSSKGRRLSITFDPDDGPTADKIFDELVRRNRDPQRSEDGLTIEAAVNDFD
jgi:hypothetical protein